MTPNALKRILLIAPATGNWRKVGRARLFNGRTFRFSLLSLLSVAAETRSDIEVEIVDEQIQEIPWASPVDLVGITCMTAAAPRAYEIAARFRARGIPVVLGGMHPSLCPDEAVQFADGVVVGDAEGLWPRVLADAAAGRLKGVYRQARPPSLAGLKAPPRHLLPRRRYATLQAVQATRGCPHRCRFCSVSAFHGQVQRRRPVADVVGEVAGLPGRFFVFVDDNLTADREYAAELLAGLRPLRKRWITQATLAMTNERGLVGRMAEAGCLGVFAGLETFSRANLGEVRKDCHGVDQYRSAIDLLHAHGIGVEAGIVFGFDQDGPDVFERTVSILDELAVDAVQFSIFTPLPGTPLFESMSERILDRNWAHYDFHHVVFQPRRMSAEALQAGHDWATREFYRPWRMARRLARGAVRRGGLWVWPFSGAINLAYYGRVRRWHIRGWNPAEGWGEGGEQPVAGLAGMRLSVAGGQ